MKDDFISIVSFLAAFVVLIFFIFNMPAILKGISGNVESLDTLDYEVFYNEKKYLADEYCLRDNVLILTMLDGSEMVINGKYELISIPAK